MAMRQAPMRNISERLEKVFEKLETDPGRKGGLGLGLAIVKQIVEAHGGQIVVESRFGEGTTFSFTLPAKHKEITWRSVGEPSGRELARVLRKALGEQFATHREH